MIDGANLNICECYNEFDRLQLLFITDDILLIAPSVSELQRLFHACEFELSCLYVYQHQEIMLYTYWP